MTSIAAICLGFQAPRLGLSYREGAFWVQEARPPIRFELPAEPAPRKSVVFRVKDRFAVWDDRGLTVRAGNKVASNRLTALSVSPRLQSREEIVATLEKVKRGERRREANALSGAAMIGNVVYFMPRWEDRGRRTWLEAIVMVDLGTPNPAPKLAGKPIGQSLAYRPVDDQLKASQDRLLFVARLGEAWGVSEFEAQTRTAGFIPVGRGLREARELRPMIWAFVERTEYATEKLGRVHLPTRTRRDLLESADRVRLVDDLQPLMVLVNRRGQLALRNAGSGAERPVDRDARVLRTTAGVVVWTGGTRPRRAELLEPGRLETIAVWPEPMRPSGPSPRPSPSPAASGRRP